MSNKARAFDMLERQLQRNRTRRQPSQPATQWTEHYHQSGGAGYRMDSHGKWHVIHPPLNQQR